MASRTLTALLMAAAACLAAAIIWVADSFVIGSLKAYLLLTESLGETSGTVPAQQNRMSRSEATRFFRMDSLNRSTMLVDSLGSTVRRHR